MNIFEEIINHKNKKYILQEILNETAYFLYESFYMTSMWKSKKEAQEGLKEIVETYLSTHRRIEYEHFSEKKSYKDFLSDEETIHRAMNYLVKTLIGKDGSFPELNLISIWIALNRKEEEFSSFYEELKKEETLTMGEALTAYWLYYSYPGKEPKTHNSEKEDKSEIPD